MRRVSSLLFVTLLSAIPVDAQTTANGSVRGVVRDEHGAAVPGVTVSATSPTAPGIHETTTDGQGRYRLADLPPGEYAVSARLAGFARVVRSPVWVRAGLNLDVDLVVRVGGVDETVEVLADTPLIDTQRAGTAVNVSGELVRALPLLERHDWFGALTLAPGVTSAEWVNNERMFFVHGADLNANIVQIDGADVSPTLGSAIRHVGLSTDAVDDVQIKTAGVDASAPLGVGGIINIATASGTNRAKGAATVSHQPRAWNASNTPGGTSAIVAQTQADVSLGAPVVKDHLWAFGAYRYTDATSGVSRTPEQLAAMRALVPGYRPADSISDGHFWFGKLSAQPHAAHQITGFYQYDMNPVWRASATGENPSGDRTGGIGTSARLSSVWSNRLTTRLGASYNGKRRNTVDPDLGRPFERMFHATLPSGGRAVGNGMIGTRGSPIVGWVYAPNAKATLSLDATFLGSAWGQHELQTGVYAQPMIRLEQRINYVNGGTVIEDFVLGRSGDFGSGLRPFHRQVMDGTQLTALRVEGQDYAFYIQDAWRPGSRITVNAGLRIDRVTWRDRLFDVRSQRSTDIGPRLGLNYALTADDRNVARVHWVRVHDQPPAMASGVGSVSLGFRDVYDLDLDGTFETTFVTPATFAITRGRTRDPELHQPFVQEWGAGFTRQLRGRTSVGIDFVHRDYRHRPTLVETNGRYEGTRFVGYTDEAFNDTYLVTNNRSNWPAYASLEISISKRAARVQGLASYVRQWRHMAGTWQPHDPASFIQPSAFPNDRGIGTPTGALSHTGESNSLSGTHMTQRDTASAQWQDHVVRGGVHVAGPWGLMAAASYTFQSGAWSGPIVTRVAAPDPAFGPATVTLSNGRAVSNPLATLVRFAHPTRGDGQLTTPDFHVVSLRVGRRFAVRGLRLDAAVEAFNLTNNGAFMSFQFGANQLYNPLYGLMEFRQLPRSAQASLRASF